MFDTFRAAHSDDLSLVTRDGTVVSGAELLTGLAAARGTQPGLRITVSEVAVVHASDDAALVRFVEQHRGQDGGSDRIVSALLRADTAAPRGLRWHHVHENEPVSPSDHIAEVRLLRNAGRCGATP